MNLLLFKKGYPPTIIQRTNWRQYYQVLMRADQDESEPLVNFVGSAIGRSLILYLEACTPQSAPPEVQETWIRLAEAVEGTPYSQEYLSLLARKGRLEALKRRRDFSRTQVWVSDVTYIRLQHDFVYLEIIMDVLTRALRGWCLSRISDQKLTLTAVNDN